MYACMSGCRRRRPTQRVKEDKMPQALRAFRGLYSQELSRSSTAA